jgi:hypothetical protein
MFICMYMHATEHWRQLQVLQQESSDYAEIHCCIQKCTYICIYLHIYIYIYIYIYIMVTCKHRDRYQRIIFAKCCTYITFPTLLYFSWLNFLHTALSLGKGSSSSINNYTYTHTHSSLLTWLYFSWLNFLYTALNLGEGSSFVERATCMRPKQSVMQASRSRIVYWQWNCSTDVQHSRWSSCVYMYVCVYAWVYVRVYVCRYGALEWCTDNGIAARMSNILQQLCVYVCVYNALCVWVCRQRSAGEAKSPFETAVWESLR